MEGGGGEELTPGVRGFPSSSDRLSPLECGWATPLSFAFSTANRACLRLNSSSSAKKITLTAQHSTRARQWG